MFFGKKIKNRRKNTHFPDITSNGFDVPLKNTATVTFCDITTCNTKHVSGKLKLSSCPDITFRNLLFYSLKTQSKNSFCNFIFPSLENSIIE